MAGPPRPVAPEQNPKIKGERTMNRQPLRPREPGSIWDTICDAMREVGGAEAMALAVKRKPYWSYVVSDDVQSAKQRTQLSYADACDVAKAGGVALAQHIALCAGGVFLPVQAGNVAAVQSHAAKLSQESGEAVSVLIQRIVDGDFDKADRKACLPELLDLLQAVMPLIAMCREDA